MPLNRFFDNFSSFDSNKGIMGDFTHASNVYRRNNFRLAPKNKFLYHVVVDVNQFALAQLGRSVSNQLNKREYNILASAADLPTYSVDTETHMQYNRKKVVQKSITYNPCSIEFHDDAAGLTTLLWEAYYRYYYEDGNYADQGEKPRAYYTGLYDSEPQNTYRHGFNRSRTADPFFNSITIHQLHHQNIDSHHTSFTLVNPLIQEWQHDRLDQADATGVMKNTMRVEYEAVMYNRGYTRDGDPAGFADDAHYDKSPSPYNSISSSSIENTVASTESGWTTLFTDIFESILGLGDFNTQQQADLRKPFNLNPVTFTPGENAANNLQFPPNVFNANITNTTPFSQPVDNFQTQEFIRTLGNNPKALSDYAKQNASVMISVRSGLNISESKAFYDTLSPELQAGIQQATFENAIELSKNSYSPSFNQALENLNVIEPR